MTIAEVLEYAQGLCEGASPDSEYVRGQAELICDLFGIPQDSKAVVVAAITERIR